MWLILSKPFILGSSTSSPDNSSAVNIISLVCVLEFCILATPPLATLSSDAAAVTMGCWEYHRAAGLWVVVDAAINQIEGTVAPLADDVDDKMRALRFRREDDTDLCVFVQWDKEVLKLLLQLDNRCVVDCCDNIRAPRCTNVRPVVIVCHYLSIQPVQEQQQQQQPIHSNY